MRSMTRSRTVLALLALGALLLGLSRAPWVQVVLNGAVRRDTVTVAAADVAPQVPAAALMVLAAATALSIAGPRARRVILALATLGGVLAVWGCVTVLTDPRRALVTALTGRVVPSASPGVTAAVWASSVVSVLVAVVSGAAQRTVGTWPGRRASSGRFDRATVSDAVHTPAGDWDALTRGEDPTRED